MCKPDLGLGTESARLGKRSEIGGRTGTRYPMLCVWRSRPHVVLMLDCTELYMYSTESKPLFFVRHHILSGLCVGQGTYYWQRFFREKSHFEPFVAVIQQKIDNG